VGRQKAKTIKKVPGKPKSSPLLLKPEMDLINGLSAKLFGRTSMEELDFDTWCKLLLQDGIEKIRSSLKIIYNNRQTYLLMFAKLTTSRLNQVRRLPGVNPQIKKAGITTEQVAAVVLNREDPVSSLTQEILTIDPTGNLFINQYFAGDTNNFAVSTLSEADTRGLISKIIVDSHVYEDLRKTRDAGDPWILRYLESERNHQITKQEFDRLRKQIRESERPRKVKINRDITLYDLIKSKAKVILPKAQGKKPVKVPHEVSKPSGAGNTPSKRKGKSKPLLIEDEYLQLLEQAKQRIDELKEQNLETPDLDDVEEELAIIEENPYERKLLMDLALQQGIAEMRDFLSTSHGMAWYQAFRADAG
jgi:hypothetical protein